MAGDLVSEKYRLKQLLGQGGMGSVWLARNVTLDVPVALKLIRSEKRSSDSADRLLNEARAAARLRHPGIVRVFDFGQTERDEPFIVMELLSGESLAERLDRERRLSSTAAVQLLLPIADALAGAHAQGVIHRDLKPDNVFLSEADGRVQPKIVDFGVAKFELQDRKHITEQGAVLGSPDYMAPEQALGADDLDHRVDVWAFCVVLYECVTGRSPFAADDYKGVMLQIIEGTPASTTELAAGDADLWQIIERGLKKEPAERWPNMRELGAALASWLVGHGVTEDICGHSLRAAWLGGQPASSAGQTPPPIDISAQSTEGPRSGRWRLPAVIVFAAVTASSGPLAWLWPRARLSPGAEAPARLARNLVTAVGIVRRDRASRLASAPGTMPGAPSSKKAGKAGEKAGERTGKVTEKEANQGVAKNPEEARNSAMIYGPPLRPPSAQRRVPPSRPRGASVSRSTGPRDEDFGF